MSVLVRVSPPTELGLVNFKVKLVFTLILLRAPITVVLLSPVTIPLEFTDIPVAEPLYVLLTTVCAQRLLTSESAEVFTVSDENTYLHAPLPSGFLVPPLAGISPAGYVKFVV